MGLRVTLKDIAQKAGLLTLPPSGAWVCIKGCPVWPRGQRLISAHREIGIQHLDIYWGYSETLASRRPRVHRHRKRNLELPAAVLYDMHLGATFDKALDRAANELRDLVKTPLFSSHLQSTLVTISHPHPEEVRFFNSEVVVIEADFIRRLLEANYLEAISFAQSSFALLEDAAQEIVDALRVDGLSHAEAYHMVLTAGIIETEEQFIPTWYYRPINEFRTAFVEE